VFVYARPDSQNYLIEHDSRTVSENSPPLLSALRQFVLRAKVKLRDVSEEYDVWAAWGSDDDNDWETERHWSRADNSNIAEPLWDNTTPESASPWGTQDLVLRDRRAVGMGHRLLVKRGERPQAATNHDVGGSRDYMIHRYLNGVPEGALEIQQGHAFPMESNMDIMGAVDFRKGCYVGQELTVRTYHTGVNRKRIFPITIDPLHQTHEDSTSEELPISDPTIRPVVQESSSGTPALRKPRGTNKLLGSINGIGLALLRLDHVEAVDKKTLQFAMGEGEGECRVEHWYPTWWPSPHSILTRTA